MSSCRAPEIFASSPFTASLSSMRLKALRPVAKAAAMSGTPAPVSAWMRTTMVGPPRLTIELASMVEMISRRSLCASMACG